MKKITFFVNRPCRKKTKKIFRSVTVQGLSPQKKEPESSFYPHITSFTDRVGGPGNRECRAKKDAAYWHSQSFPRDRAG